MSCSCLGQVIGRGSSAGTWQVAPYLTTGLREEAMEVPEDELYFPRKTILSEVDWSLPSTRDGKLLPGRIQRFSYDPTFWCELK